MSSLSKEHFDEVLKHLPTRQDLRGLKSQVDRVHQLVAGFSDQINDINSRLLEIEEILDDQTIESHSITQQYLKKMFSATSP